MCEIQFIKRINGNLNTKDINEFVKLLQFGSINNSDAFGLFNDSIIFKKSGIVNLKKFNLDLLKDCSFIVGHNRFKTNGDEKKNFNNHPFTLNDFVMVHNGIIQNYEEIKKEFKIDGFKIETDSFYILYLIDYYYNLSKKNNKHKKTIDAIKKTTKKLEGSFSIFLFNNDTKKLYYFKNDRTNFSFIKINNVLIGTTNSLKLDYTYLNDSYFKLYKSNRTNIKIKDNCVYYIDELANLNNCGQFKDKDTFNFKNYSMGTYIQDIKTQDKDEFYNECEVYNEYELSLEIENTLNEKLGYIPQYVEHQDYILITDQDINISNVFKNVAKKTNYGIKIYKDDILTNSNLYDY